MLECTTARIRDVASILLGVIYSMQAQEKKIQDVLSESRQFSIPDYQRPYSWEERNVQQLLEDIYEAFSKGEAEYFIGSLILIGNEKTRFDVVDGQQRLTTLTIIFAAIRDILTEPAQRAWVQQRFLPVHPMTGKMESPRLLVREQDRKVFLEAILLGGFVDESDQLSDSQVRMLRNQATALAFLKVLPLPELVRFESYLEENVWIVWVAVSGFESAFRLFNVLNARGVPLSNGDLIKSHLYGRSQGDEASQAIVKEGWEELEERIGLRDLDMFLAHYRTSHLASKPDRALYEEYQALLKHMALSPADFTKALVNAAKVYRRILDNNFSESVGVRRLVASLQRVHYDEWIPPLLSFLDAAKPGMSAERFVELLEKITYQGWVRRLSRSQRNTIYYQLIKQVRLSTEANELSRIFESSANNAEFLSLVGGDVYRHASARAILLRLEESMQDESVTKVFNGQISVEHVLPQAPTDAYWQSRFRPEDCQEWVHRLGNLCLLSGSKNSSAQNSDFEKKKTIYLQRDKKVSFDLTKAVCTEAEWTLAVISLRQAALVERAKQLWSIGAA